jgi:uncharacterized protein YlzI (FlbEa/FlbD family)
LDEGFSARRTEMPRQATAALAALLVFGTASAVCADMPGATAYHSSFAEHSVSTVPTDLIAAVNDAAKNKDSLVASQLNPLQRAFFCRRDISIGTTAWLKLTEPGGKLIHINLEHITSVRSTTQVPGARAQLDLASGKFQGVQEDVEEVMQLISAASGARGDHNT